MAFSGDLEHLSIVDVIQLLHTSRKSGSLVVKGRKGEVSLAFNDGYVIGAQHCDDARKIGCILISEGIISQDVVERGLAIQQAAGPQRKPLVATLVENGLADRNDAYRGLQTLIEMTIVEILTWKTGSFELVVAPVTVCDEYRYAPEILNEDLFIPTEHLLMDALRIYDEKRRDGLIVEEDGEWSNMVSERFVAPDEISAMDLGLDDLDDIQRKIPDVHAPLKDRDGLSVGREDSFEAVLRQSTTRLQQVLSLPETALVLLETVSRLFPRSLTLVVRPDQLIAERSMGIVSPVVEGPSQVMGFKIPVPQDSLFGFLLDRKHIFYGKSDDATLKLSLHGVIGVPKHPELLLMPLKVGGRVASFTYADFGDLPAVAVPVVALELFANQAAMALENALLRRQQAGK